MGRSMKPRDNTHEKTHICAARLFSQGCEWWAATTPEPWGRHEWPRSQKLISKGWQMNGIIILQSGSTCVIRNCWYCFLKRLASMWEQHHCHMWMPSWKLFFLDQQPLMGIPNQLLCPWENSWISCTRRLAGPQSMKRWLFLIPGISANSRAWSSWRRGRSYLPPPLVYNMSNHTSRVTRKIHKLIEQYVDHPAEFQAQQKTTTHCYRPTKSKPFQKLCCILNPMLEDCYASYASIICVCTRICLYIYIGAFGLTPWLARRSATKSTRPRKRRLQQLQLNKPRRSIQGL